MTIDPMTKQLIKLSYIWGVPVPVKHVWYLACLLDKAAAFTCNKYSVPSGIKY